MKCHFNPQFEAHWIISNGKVVYPISSVVMEDMIALGWFKRSEFVPIVLDK